MPDSFDNTTILESERSARNGLDQFPKIVCVALGVEPAPVAMAFVLQNLLSRIPRGRAVIAAERLPQNGADQTSDSNGIPIRFIARKWTWPKRGQRYVHWLRWGTFPLTLFKLIRVVKCERAEAIFVNFPNEFLLFAAYLTSCWTGLPLFPYFHNTYRENRTGLAGVFAGWLQARVFARAATVFTMSRGMNEYLERLYPNVRFRPIVHTFAGEIPPPETLPPIDPTNVRLGFMGSINESNLEALRRICRTVNERPRFRLTFFSNSPSWFYKKAGLVGPRIDSETPSDEQLLERMRACDILLLPHGFTGGLSQVEYDTIFPTRTVMYLLSRRPSLLHSPAECFFTRWIVENRCATIVDRPDVEALGVALDQLVADDAERARLVEHGLQAVKAFELDAVFAKFREDLRVAFNTTINA